MSRWPICGHWEPWPGKMKETGWSVVVVVLLLLLLPVKAATGDERQADSGRSGAWAVGGSGGWPVSVVEKLRQVPGCCSATRVRPRASLRRAASRE